MNFVLFFFFFTPNVILVIIQLLFFCFPFFVFLLSFHYLIPTSYLVQQLISMYCKVMLNSMRQTAVRPE